MALAVESGLSYETVRNFETRLHAALPRTIAVLRIALENASVEFVVEDGGDWSVRLRKAAP